MRLHDPYDVESDGDRIEKEAASGVKFAALGLFGFASTAVLLLLAALLIIVKAAGWIINWIVRH